MSYAKEDSKDKRTVQEGQFQYRRRPNFKKRTDDMTNYSNPSGTKAHNPNSDRMIMSLRLADRLLPIPHEISCLSQELECTSKLCTVLWAQSIHDAESEYRLFQSSCKEGFQISPSDCIRQFPSGEQIHNLIPNQRTTTIVKDLKLSSPLVCFWSASFGISTRTVGGTVT